MVQTGDPTGTGKGGASIWGGKFEDEVRDDLRHNSRGMVSRGAAVPLLSPDCLGCSHEQ